ncbi:hypothetical protein RRG08_036503 [Elysia crispata]|uniref:Uncharacterized protein n=1 Tax=Elysia crispata TaxID=231223 RepID=A0AAE0ZK30_9GAST|nr:hypothetical protein RRG08_036503 [Elysia crispata]
MSVETTIEHLASNVTGVQAGPSESIDALHTGELIRWCLVSVCRSTGRSGSCGSERASLAPVFRLTTCLVSVKSSAVDRWTSVELVLGVTGSI